MKAAYIIDARDWKSRALTVPVPHDRIGVRAAVSELFAVGFAHLESGDRGAAETILDEIGRRTRVARAAAGVEYDAGVEAAELLELELSASLRLARGETAQALEMMTAAAAREDEMPFEFGPPFVVKPTHELHGETLLGLGRADEAHAAFQRSLERAPRRIASLLGLARAAAAMGNREAAVEAYREIGEAWHRADRELPEREEIFRFVTAGSRHSADANDEPTTARQGRTP
jgi:tetratricopeptide (TPR) repeat protein